MAATMTAGIDAGFLDGERYELAIRGHRITVDQPVHAGGADSAPTPTELFVASLAACVVFYAGRYLTRHGYERDGLTVSTEYDMATDRPARVTAVRLVVHPPADFPADGIPALTAVASHCTVHNSLTRQPDVTITVE
jgi:uncharacterized OsmC-like protein